MNSQWLKLGDCKLKSHLKFPDLAPKTVKQQIWKIFLRPQPCPVLKRIYINEGSTYTWK